MALKKTERIKFSIFEDAYLDIHKRIYPAFRGKKETAYILETNNLAEENSTYISSSLPEIVDFIYENGWSELPLLDLANFVFIVHNKKRIMSKSLSENELVMLSQLYEIGDIKKTSSI